MDFILTPFGPFNCRITHGMNIDYVSDLTV